MEPEIKVECCNPDCEWSGSVSDCVHFHNDPTRKPYCPECHEVVEPDSATEKQT
jgi:hypothetical protein